MSEAPETTDPLHPVRSDLRAIVALAGDLSAQAVNLAADKSMPGGDALAALAPFQSMIYS